MGNAADFRTLDEIITANALLLLKRRVAARRVERKPYYLNTLAEEMVPHMVPPEEREAPGWNKQTAVDRISHTVARYLGLGKSSKVAWRVDYLEGFYHAMGVTLHEMTAPENGLDDAEHALLESMSQHASWIVPAPKSRGRKVFEDSP